MNIDGNSPVGSFAVPCDRQTRMVRLRVFFASALESRAEKTC
jgi:hypothetical protein